MATLRVVRTGACVSCASREGVRLRVVLDGALLEEHRAVLGEVDAKQEQRDADDHDTEVDDAVVGAVAALEEGPGGDDRAEVAAGAHHARDDAQRGARDVGHDAEVEALRHLHEDGEDDDDDDGDAKGSAVRDAVVVVADLGPLSVDHHVAERRVLDQNELVLDAEAVLHGVGRLDRLGAARQHLERLAVGVGDVAAAGGGGGGGARRPTRVGGGGGGGLGFFFFLGGGGGHKILIV